MADTVAPTASSPTSDDVGFPDDAHATATGISNEKLAMWVFLASDCLLFGGLISTYLLYKNRPGTIAGPATGSGRSKIVRALRHPVHVGELVHAADELADDGARGATRSARNDAERMRLWLGATAALGCVHRRPGLRVHRFVTRGPRLHRQLSSSAFFTLTGFHGVHVPSAS